MIVPEFEGLNRVLGLLRHPARLAVSCGGPEGGRRSETRSRIDGSCLVVVDTVPWTFGPSLPRDQVGIPAPRVSRDQAHRRHSGNP